MSNCLKCDGNNTEPMYHMGKAALRRGGMLPIVLTVDHKLLVADAQKFLASPVPPPDKEKKDKKMPAVPPTFVPSKANLDSDDVSSSD